MRHWNHAANFPATQSRQEFVTAVRDPGGHTINYATRTRQRAR
jgi:hypothetical protein